MVLQRVSGFQALVMKNLSERRLRAQQPSAASGRGHRQPATGKKHDERSIQLLEWQDLRRLPPYIVSMIPLTDLFVQLLGGSE